MIRAMETLWKKERNKGKHLFNETEIYLNVYHRQGWIYKGKN